VIIWRDRNGMYRSAVIPKEYISEEVLKKMPREVKVVEDQEMMFWDAEKLVKQMNKKHKNI